MDDSADDTTGRPGRGATVPPPDRLPAYPEADRVRPKTLFAGGRRRRWHDDKGFIYEWDYRHGTVEIYDRFGKHLGEFDHRTGQRLSGPIAGRSVEP